MMFFDWPGYVLPIEQCLTTEVHVSIIKYIIAK